MKRLILITSLFFITGLVNNVFAATVKVVDGVTYIHNTDKPKFSQPTIELQEEWRIGGEDPGFIFNSPSGVDVDDDGRILVTDILEHDVKIFNPVGKLLKEFGSEGKGPGEFIQNFSIASLSKDKLLVIDSGVARPYSRFNYFDYNGNFIGNEDILFDANDATLQIGNNGEDWFKFSVESKLVYDERLVGENLWLRVHYANFTKKEDCQAILRFDMQNKVSREVYVRSEKSGYLNKDKKKNKKASLGTYILWCENKYNTLTVIPDLFDYRIFIYNNSDALVKVLGRDFTLPVKSKYEYEGDKHHAQYYENLITKDKVKFNVLKNNAIIKNDYHDTGGLFYDDKEHLWVLTNESFKERKQNVNDKVNFFSAFDVFDVQGEYLMRIPIKTHVKAGNFKYKNGFLYFFDNDKEGYKWLIKMRVVDKI